MKYVIALLTLILACVAPALAQDTKADLQARFKARDAQLRQLRQEGKVGETIDGFVDAVDPAAVGEPEAKLLSDENEDRKALYRILADEINTENPDAKVKATPETVAARNALRNAERAGPDEFLRVAKNHWIRIRELPRYQKLVRFKAQGRIGENPGGLVEVVKPEDQTDSALAALVREENDARSAQYKALAQKEGVDTAAVAKRMAKRNFDNARVGDMLKSEDGKWSRK